MQSTPNSYFLLALMLLAAMPAGAALVEATVVPPTTSMSVEVRLNADLPAADRFGRPVDNRTPLKDVLPKLPASALVFRVQPATITWGFVCDILGETISSPRGEFRGDGRLLASNGLLATPCTNIVLPISLAETLVFPVPVLNYLKELFYDVPVGDIVAGRTVSRTTSLTYTRKWSSTGGGVTPQVTASFVVNSALRSDVNGARLVSVRGETRAANRNLPLTAGAVVNVPVDWVATVEVIGRGTPLTVSSSSIEFRTSDGGVLDRQTKPLNQPALARVSTMETRLTETVIVPSTVALQARQARSANVIVHRSFTDGTVTAEAEVVLALGGAASGSFQIAREDLRFHTEARIEAVEPGSLLYAVVDLNYTGTGQFIATWEWAPLPAGGTALFRPLPVVATAEQAFEVSAQCRARSGRPTQTLVRELATGFQHVALCSPPLPTKAEGSYVVQLRVDVPDVTFDPPVVPIRYFVTRSGADIPDMALATGRPALQLIAPAAGDIWTEAHRFAWQPVPKVAAYRIEFYAQPRDTEPMLSGVLVEGTQTSAALSGIAQSHLQTGPVYWRVVAFGDDGRVGAVSSLRVIRIMAR